jgi:hypothetical protein
MSTSQRAHKKANPAPAVEPVVIDANTLAAWIQTSKTTLYRRLALGQVLRPLAQWGQQPRWDAAEARAWIKAGMPDQRAWEALKAKHD